MLIDEGRKPFRDHCDLDRGRNFVWQPALPAWGREQWTTAPSLRCLEKISSRRLLRSIQRESNVARYHRKTRGGVSCSKMAQRRRVVNARVRAFSQRALPWATASAR